jgi:FkbM family methyltransferase
MRTPRAVVALRHLSRAPEVLRCMGTFDSWPTLVPGYLGLRSMPLPFAARTRAGAAFRLTEFYDLETLWQIYCREVYAVAESDRVIVDAGANIGLFTCFAAARAPQARVHSIEPFPATYDRLVETVRASGFDSRVTCHRIALSSSGGVSTMSAAAEASQMFHLASGTTGAGIAVTTTTLTAFLDSIDAAAIDLLKMDIEGSEYDVLLSTPPGVLSRIGRVDLEFHKAPSPDCTPHTLVRHLSGAGFRLREQPAPGAEYGMLHFIR